MSEDEHGDRGNDFEEVVPAGRTFLGAFAEWLGGHLEAARQRRRVEALAEARDLGALVEALGAEGVDAAFTEMLGEQADPRSDRPISPDVCWVMYQRWREDDHVAAGQALVLGGHWAELVRYGEALRERLERGELEPTRFTEVTLRTHLAIAAAALGTPERGPAGPHPAKGTYAVRGPGLVAKALGRWEDERALLVALTAMRVDVALALLARMPARVLAARLSAVDAIVGKALEAVASKTYVEPDLVPGIVGKLIDAVVAGAQDGHAPIDAARRTLGELLLLASPKASTKGFARDVARIREIGEPPFEAREAGRAAFAERFAQDR